MAEYPNAIFEKREVENLPGLVFNPEQKTVLFAEDYQSLADEITAIEETLGTNVEGEYETLVDRLAHIDDILADFNDMSDPGAVIFKNDGVADVDAAFRYIKDENYLSLPLDSSIGTREGSVSIKFEGSTGYLRIDNWMRFFYDVTGGFEIQPNTNPSPVLIKFPLHSGTLLAEEEASDLASFGSGSYVGERHVANDLTSTTFYDVAVGSDVNIAPIFWDGSVWRIG